MPERIVGMSRGDALVAESAKLPAPDTIALAHSDRLSAILQQRIVEQGGCIPFSDYMETVLYEPGLGYYMAGAAKFGAQGDFVTAPEISPLFGKALSVQFAEILSITGGGILELGAGSGRLALSVLQTIPRGAGFHYSILEPSAELAHRQFQLLSEHLSEAVMSSVRWLDALPEKQVGVIVANEVMDALPVERFRAGSSLEREYVNSDLRSTFMKDDGTLAQQVADIEADIGMGFPADYTSELCTVLKPWLQSLAACLDRGVIVLADYGYPRHEYYSPERVAGTLACYYQHRMHVNPYHYPGLQDVTAHVDFTAVAEAAVASGLDLLGYASQSAFLLDNELLALAEEQRDSLDREADRLELSRCVKILTLPGEMGGTVSGNCPG